MKAGKQIQVESSLIVPGLDANFLVAVIGKMLYSNRSREHSWVLNFVPCQWLHRDLQARRDARELDL